MSHWLLLRAYPRWFRAEFGAQLTKHLAHQRTEPRYRARMRGWARFWWDAGTDAVATGVTLRLGRLRERSAGFRRGAQDGGNGGSARGAGRGPGAARIRTMLDGVQLDLRQAMRCLAQTPGYTLVFIVTLGLGIGANTAMFTAVNDVLLRPLPNEDGDRLVYLRHSARPAGMPNVLFSVAEIDDYRKGSPSLEAIAEFSALTFTMLGYETPRRVRAGIVTGDYFEVMGLSATLGRTVGREDDGRGAPAVIVLSDAYWRDVLGADPQIVGKTVQINGQTATFVGVAEPAPPYPERTDIYVNMATSPHHLSASMSGDRSHRMTEAFGKLAADATVESVRKEVSVTTARIHAEYPEAYDAGSGFDVTVTPLKKQLTSRARPTFLLLLATTSFVLIIACANLANLTMARVSRREHELAIRVSLGGSRAALRRGLLVESLVLAVAGAGVGLLVATVSLDLLVGFAARFTSRASEIALDRSVFGFALLAAVGASVLFTMLPALPDPDILGGAPMRRGIRSAVGSRTRRTQRILVVAQVGTSFVLLIGAGLFLRTIMHLNHVDPGFDTARILTMDIPPNATGRAEEDIRDQYLAILDDVDGLPGVESAALTSSIPLAGPSIFTTQTEIDVDGYQRLPRAPRSRADFRVVSPGYFSTMGIEILRGREFVTTDLADARKVVVINESMARAYFGERNPIGRRIAWTDENMRFLGLGDEWRTVVGVVADTRDGGLDADVVHAMYNPYAQVTPQATGSLVIRVSGEAAAVVPAVLTAIREHDPNQPIDKVATIAELRNESVAPRRLNAMLLGGFAMLALVIAAVGLSGVLALSVGSRTHEFGVRRALGAARHQIWGGVLAEGVALTVIGVVVGGVAAVALARFIAGLLVGVPSLDPVTFVTVGLLLGAVAIVAAWVPAWRAAAVNPRESLGSD